MVRRGAHNVILTAGACCARAAWLLAHLVGAKKKTPQASLMTGSREVTPRRLRRCRYVECAQQFFVMIVSSRGVASSVLFGGALALHSAI